MMNVLWIEVVGQFVIVHRPLIYRYLRNLDNYSSIIFIAFFVFVNDKCLIIARILYCTPMFERFIEY